VKQAKRNPEAETGRSRVATTARPAHASGLGDLRRKIDSLDGEVLRLLARRRALSSEIIGAKRDSDLPLRDSAREEELLGRLISEGRRRGLDAHYVTRVYHEVIADSLRTQGIVAQQGADSSDDAPGLVRMAFQGIEGAYSHLAGVRHLSSRADSAVFLGLASFAVVVTAVEEGGAELGILPVENTTSGAINEVYDLLLSAHVSIVGEVKLRVDHCLVSLSRVHLPSLRTIYAHPQAAAQCSLFLASLPSCQVRPFNDTAESVRKVKQDGDVTTAAIASAEAAHLFGLTVLKRGIANHSENFTRFVVIARTPQAVDLRVPSKTSIVMATGHQAGALVEALVVFRDHGINLAKLESRPILGNPWEEMFYLDFQGNIADPKVQSALDQLTRSTRFVRILGCFPSDDQPPTVAAITPPAPSETRAGEGDGVTEDHPTPPVQPRRSGYRLASRAHKPADTVIEVRGVKIGGDRFVVIAGPCAVESEAQISTCAQAVREHGGAVLRGGCFKPRSSPYSFQGLGWAGLELLTAAARAYDLPIITEVLAPADVERVSEHTDILQVGARNMQNFPLLRAVGHGIRPVMLKRGMMSSIEELLQAAEYILAQGNQQVILCERGIRTFETATRNTLDLSAIPILKARTHLPILVDPSHAAGERDLVPPLARAAHAVGAHGIMVEIHPHPEQALSDGAQSLTLGQFAELMRDVLGGAAPPTSTQAVAGPTEWLFSSGCG
jgi:chorismate mutase/prephenate dehydratase